VFNNFFLWYTVCVMGAESMPLNVELIPDPEQGGFTACVPDIPAYGEGETEQEAIEDLKEALRVFIETVGLDDALSRVRPRSAVKEIDLDLAELARG
jgi:predicted RNase H-like HicB family nuclease